MTCLICGSKIDTISDNINVELCCYMCKPAFIHTYGTFDGFLKDGYEVQERKKDFKKYLRFTK